MMPCGFEICSTFRALICALALLSLGGALGASPVPHKEKPSPVHALADGPAYCAVKHDINQVALGLTNFGWLGSYGTKDCLTGSYILYSCEYPKHSKVEYLWLGGLWVGAIVGRDTLVSCAVNGTYEGSSEMNPDISPFGDFIGRSIIDRDDPAYDGAISEQDRICQYFDTLTGYDFSWDWDYMDHRPHKPLGVQVTQSSYAWSYGYAENIILLNYDIKNISEETWEEAYLSLYFDPSIGVGYGASDDQVGFRRTAPSALGCGFEDTINVAWAADNDGDPIDGVWVEPARRVASAGSVYYEGSARAAFGVRVLEPPSKELRLSFNWWGDNYADIDWGPRHRDDTRDFGEGDNGNPLGDRNRYHVMSNQEFDYDQAFTTRIFANDPVWQYPPQNVAEQVAVGTDVAFLLSYGPFMSFAPGQSASMAVGIILGHWFHSYVGNASNLGVDPYTWRARLYPEELDRDAVWAEWLYDNPGRDTDGDGYAGEFRICVYDSVETDTGWVAVADTNWYRGDGVPDWRGAAPPAAPYVWVEPFEYGVRIRFNGELSETDIDVFSQEVDFEGYRVYMGRDERRESMTLLASFDHENYDKWVYNRRKFPKAGWDVLDDPWTLEGLRCRYGEHPDPCHDEAFHPMDYIYPTTFSPRNFPESLFCFTEHDYNRHEFGVSTDIRRVYPDVRDPRTVSVEALTEDDYTAEGHLKFFEYEYVIEGLLPTVPYWVNVTAFDHGSPRSNLEALETARDVGSIEFFPTASKDIQAGTDDRIYVYPNPYRVDGGYRAMGYEGRTEPNRANFRVREVHFANLPPRCTISIYSLDGDLIRMLKHDMPADDTANSNHSWDLITRNSQLLVSGLYYWVVEIPGRPTQIGKLAVIK